MKAVASMNGNV